MRGLVWHQLHPEILSGVVRPTFKPLAKGWMVAEQSPLAYWTGIPAHVGHIVWDWSVTLLRRSGLLAPTSLALRCIRDLAEAPSHIRADLSTCDE
jgi:hypothetical protein